MKKLLPFILLTSACGVNYEIGGCADSPFTGTFDIEATFVNRVTEGEPAASCGDIPDENEVRFFTWKITHDDELYSLLAVDENQNEQVIGTSSDGTTFSFSVGQSGFYYELYTAVDFCDAQFSGSQYSKFIVSPSAGGTGYGSCTDNWEIIGQLE